MAKLTFVLEQGERVVVPLADAATWTLGRGDDNDMVVDDARVSTHHAALECSADGTLAVRDLNSTAGTFVNGERVRHRCSVRDGDTLAFGPLTAVVDLEGLRPGLNGHAQNGAGTPKQTARPDTLPAEEARLGQLKAAVAEVLSSHQQWTEAVQKLSAVHAAKEAEVQRLLAAEAATRQEIASLAAHKDQELAQLRQLQEERQHHEAHLEKVRQDTATEAERHKQLEALAVVRDDQVTLAEKKLADIADRRTRLEAEVKELAGQEEKLAQAQARNREVDAQHTALLAAIRMLDTRRRSLETECQGLDNRLREAQDSLAQTQAATEEAQAGKQRAEGELRDMQAQVKVVQNELAAETRRLEKAAARRDEIIQQCEDLAGTRQELAELTTQLAVAEKRQHRLQEDMTGKEGALKELEAACAAVAGQEAAAKQRVEALEGRENHLHTELENLATAEHSARVRFEELRQLLAEAEQEHQLQQEEHAAQLMTAQEEMRELESRLLPLREWKEAMDQLYARLAELPEDSQEARELWHEIEREKDALKSLVSDARSQALDIAAKKPAPPARRTLLSIVNPPQPPQETEIHPDEPAVAAAEEPVMVAAEERALRTRLEQLRESVHREESRLEFLRQERSRHEVHPRVPGGTGSEALQREHERHLEARARHDEEHLRALHHRLEQAKAEEEKRQGRITTMEHRLAELHADILEAERHRSELRQQADLAHAELKNCESALERLKHAQMQNRRR